MVIDMAMARSAVTGMCCSPCKVPPVNLWAVKRRHQVSWPSERLWTSDEMLVVSEQLEKLEDCSCQQHSRCWSDKGSDL